MSDSRGHARGHSESGLKGSAVPAKSLKLAEGMGFEPTIGCYTYNGLAIPLRRHHKPGKSLGEPRKTAKNRSGSRRGCGERNRFALARTRAQRHGALLSVSRRAISRSTASRTKSVRSSPGASTAAIRANVPSGNRACMSSDHRFFRPTREGVSHTRFSVEGAAVTVSHIRNWVDGDISYEIQNNSYQLLEQGPMAKRRRDPSPYYPAEWYDPTFKGRTTEEKISLSLLRGVGRLPPLRRYVYFLHAPVLGLVKIGISEDVEKRRKTLARQKRCVLVSLGAIEGTLADEAAWHARFADLMVEREWFRATPALLRDVRAICSTQTTPSLRVPRKYRRPFCNSTLTNGDEHG